MDDILPILQDYQVRDPYDEGDYERLTKNVLQEGQDHGRPWSLTKRIRVLPVKTGKYAGKYALYDGNARLTVLRELGAKELGVGVDVDIDYSIDSHEKLLLKVLHANDLQSP